MNHFLLFGVLNPGMYFLFFFFECFNKRKEERRKKKKQQNPAYSDIVKFLICVLIKASGNN